MPRVACKPRDARRAYLQFWHREGCLGFGDGHHLRAGERPAGAVPYRPTKEVRIRRLLSSACFLIPYGNQAHLMVYLPGRYNLNDFLGIDVPVSVAYSAAVLMLTPIVFLSERDLLRGAVR